MPHTNKPRPLPPLSEKDIARFWSHVDKRGPDDCWPWKASLLPNGYGQFHAKRRGLNAHRVAWELTNGTIPDGELTCHSCDVRYATGDPSYRKCCNPSHLWTGTDGDNQRDAAAKGRHGGFAKTEKRIAAISKMQRIRSEMQRAQTHCVNGHPFNGPNLYWTGGKRHRRKCKMCGAEWTKQWKARRAAMAN